MKKNYKLGDIAEIGRGSSPRPITDQSYFEGGDIPWVKIADATSSGKYIYETKEHVNEYGASFSRKLEPGTLITAASGVSLGFSKFLGVEGCIHDGWLYFRKIDEKVVDKEYFYYYINTLSDYFKNISYGAAIQNINTPLVKGTKVVLPSIEEQKKIAKILTSFDNAIENLENRIIILQKMAEELYKEWFVRLRFPGYRNAKIEKGIPADWEIKRISEIVECFDSNRKPLSSLERETLDKIYPYYGAASLMDYVDDYLFDGVYLLLGEDGSVITPEGTPVLQYVWGKFWVNNHAHVFRGKGSISTEMLYMMFNKMPIVDVVTGVAQPKISKGRLFAKKVLVPTYELCQKYSKIVKPIFEEIVNIQEQRDSLQKQRDLLLPRLMSGKLEIQ